MSARPPPAAARRRRAALALAAAGALVAGVVVGAGGGGDSSQPEQASAPPPAPTCPRSIAGDPRRLAGQMVIARMEDVATDAIRDRVRAGEIGGVILFPTEGADLDALGKQIAALRRVAARAGAPAPLVMVDQEGGDVKRFSELPPDRSPADIAADGEHAATAEGAATGRALRSLGIDVDLAPVLDVSTDGSFIGVRSFSSDPAEVAALGTAFGTALQAEGVAATAKHFPGLGLATANTDLGPSSIDASRAELAAGLKPFRAAIVAGFDLIMVANATYPALDPRRPASQSPRVIDGLLRDRLGYGGVVITDDLGAGALTGAGLDEGAAAIGAAGAGADLILTALSDGSAADAALVSALRDGRLDRDALVASCARTTALRRALAAQPES